MQLSGPITLRGNYLTFILWWRKLKIVLPDRELPALAWFGLSPEFEKLLCTRTELSQSVCSFRRNAQFLLGLHALLGACIGWFGSMVLVDALHGAEWSEQHATSLQLGLNVLLAVMGVAYLWTSEMYRRLKNLCAAYNQCLARAAAAAQQDAMQAQ